MREVRVFSRRGLHMLAMFARTKVAEAFRVWALNVLDGACEAIERETQLTISQELALISKTVSLMKETGKAESHALATAIYRELEKVNKRLGSPTVPFSELAIASRQRRLDEPPKPS